jgi:hypothetical protein
MCEVKRRSLQGLHRGIIFHLGSALGNLRLIAIGAPFASELVKLAEREVEAALDLAREAEQMRAALSTALGEHASGGC